MKHRLLQWTATILLTVAHVSAETQDASHAVNLPSALPDAGGSVLRVFGAFIVVVAIFLGGVWMYRNWQRFAVKRAGGAKLTLIEAKSLGQRQTIYVVGYQQQRMLLASSPAGITLISHLPAANEEEEKQSAPAPKMSFAEAFQQVLNRRP